jgi:hypothetical protein
MGGVVPRRQLPKTDITVLLRNEISCRNVIRNRFFLDLQRPARMRGLKPVF